MDSGNGYFVEPTQHALDALAIAEKDGRSIKMMFRLGQELEVNGSRFRVSNISRHKLTLLLLPQHTRLRDEPKGD